MANIGGLNLIALNYEDEEEVGNLGALHLIAQAYADKEEAEEAEIAPGDVEGLFPDVDGDDGEHVRVPKFIESGCKVRILPPDELKLFHPQRIYKEQQSEETFRFDVVCGSSSSSKEGDGYFFGGDGWRTFVAMFDLKEGQELAFEVGFGEVTVDLGTVTIIIQ